MNGQGSNKTKAKDELDWYTNKNTPDLMRDKYHRFFDTKETAASAYLGDQSRTRRNVEIMTEFHIVQHAASLVPTLTRDGPVSKRTDRMPRSSRIDNITIK
jgi:hypothetical protein